MLLSSFKLLACGHLLHRVDRGEESLDRQQGLLMSQTAGKCLEAGLPPEWRIGDKTGSNGPGVNDVAIG